MVLPILRSPICEHAERSRIDSNVISPAPFNLPALVERGNARQTCSFETDSGGWNIRDCESGCSVLNPGDGRELGTETMLTISRGVEKRLAISVWRGAVMHLREMSPARKATLTEEIKEPGNLIRGSGYHRYRLMKSKTGWLQTRQIIYPFNFGMCLEVDCIYGLASHNLRRYL